MSKTTTQTSAITNRRARFDYELSDELVVGLELTGPEVRAAREGHVQLKGAFVSVRGNELWLNNASFSLRLNQRGQQNARTIDTRPRKILAKRREINRFIDSRKSGTTIVPTKLLTHGRYIKLVIALGKGKKKHDKREAIKRRDQDREVERALKAR